MMASFGSFLIVIGAMCIITPVWMVKKVIKNTKDVSDDEDQKEMDLAMLIQSSFSEKQLLTLQGLIYSGLILITFGVFA